MLRFVRNDDLPRADCIRQAKGPATLCLCGMTVLKLNTVKLAVPVDKAVDTGLDTGSGFVAKIALEGAYVGIGFGNVARLDG